MNIIKSLTIRHLKVNRSRTVITALGIFISVFMITAVFVGVASYLSFSADVAIHNGGQWHVIFGGIKGISEEQIKMLKADDRIERVGCLVNYDNKTDSFKINGAKSDRLGTGTFFAGDENCIRQMITGNLEGSIPKNDKEIIVNREIIEKNDLDWKIGDTVTLSVGARAPKLVDGYVVFIIYYHNEYHTDEVFIPAGEKEFKIVGILDKNPPTYTSGSIIRGMGENDKISTAYIELKNVTPAAYHTINDIAKSIGIKEDKLYEYVGVNEEFLASHFAFSGDDDLSKIFSAAVIVLIIIMAASVVLIYNAFGMSLAERTRYLGMLSSVGATRKQKKASVYFEGIILGMITVPAGIGAGILGVFIILKALGEKIVKTNMIVNAGDLKMQTVVPIWSIICIVVISAVTIFISSVIPAKRASAITPIDALRQNSELKLKSKRLKSSFLVRKIFGFEGELANKNLKRNARKASIITVSIALSATLFLSVNYFCEIFVRSNDYSAETPYQIEFDFTSNSYKTYEKMKNSLKEIPGVDKVYCSANEIYLYSETAANPKKGNDYTGINQDLRKPENLTSTYKNLWDEVLLTVHFVEDDDFNALCEKNGIDYTKYYDENATFESDIKCVVMNNISHRNQGSKVFTDNFIGEKIYSEYYFLYPECDEDDNIIGWNDSRNDPDDTDGFEPTKTIITDFVEYDDDNYLCHLDGANTISAYVPVSMHKTNFLYTIDDDGGLIELGIETSDHEYVADQIGSMIDENGYEGAAVYDIQKYHEHAQTTVFVLQVFVYGFIILITLITLANIVNTISTGIDSRRREFAMFKSVGITQNGFRKMMCLESLFYGLRALIFAIPLSIVINYILNKKVGSNKIPFEINYIMYLAVIAAVFAVVGFAMLYSVSKLKKASVIETLKEDIS
ncbi:MAG: ABC transporter permease [Eubacterium sp.]|nr:ABC transporter permease [Eubacterium sp.]